MSVAFARTEQQWDLIREFFNNAITFLSESVYARAVFDTKEKNGSDRSTLWWLLKIGWQDIKRKLPWVFRNVYNKPRNSNISQR